MRALVAACAVSSLVCACAGTTDSASTAATAAALDGTRWVWLDLQCSDGAAPLSADGLARELRVAVAAGGLRLSERTELAHTGCVRSELLRARPGEGAWDLTLLSSVALPAEAECGPATAPAQRAALGLAGDVLDVVVFASPWCRGYDARFTYRRADPRALDEAQMLTEYYVLFNARDATKLAGLFAAQGSLVEPFSKTPDGVLARHQGRAQVEAWFERAFESAPRLAVRMTDLRSDAPGQYIVLWEYMDERLAEPVRGRNLFSIAAGEIYEAEVQLLEAPRTRAPDEDRPDAGGQAVP